MATTQEKMIHAPVPFAGTDEERRANRATHFFVNGRCMDCDVKEWYVSADYACGTREPRKWMLVSEYTAALRRTGR